ncbi:gag-pol polyprotein [Tanacetum coccineum]
MYHCYDPVSQKLFTSRHVDFLEHISYYCVPLSSHNLTQSKLLKNDPFDDVTHENPPVLSPVITEHAPKTTTPETTTSTKTVVDLPPSGRLKHKYKSTKRDDFVYSYHSNSFSSFIASVHRLHKPRSYRDAIFDPLWQVAMSEELIALHQTQT